MDRWLLALAMIFAAVAAVQGAGYVRRGKRSRWTMIWMLLSFCAQMALLSKRGEMRGACPLGDTGEMLAFTAWSMTICYMAIGSVFRLSLLGVFSAPLIAFLLGVALIPGVMESNPFHADHVDGWREMHAAFSVLAYGALGLAAVASAMFLVLNRLLKGGDFTPGLFKHLPPVSELSAVVRRLLWLGLGILSLGVISGLIMKSSGEAGKHLIAAIAQWVGYFTLLIFIWRQGMPPKRMALITIALFFFSLLIFPLL